MILAVTWTWLDVVAVEVCWPCEDSFLCLHHPCSRPSPFEPESQALHEALPDASVIQAEPSRAMPCHTMPSTRKTDRKRPRTDIKTWRRGKKEHG